MELPARLEHAKLFLNEVTFLPAAVASDSQKSIAMLQNRLQLLENHEKTIKQAIRLVKKEIQNQKKQSQESTNT